MERGRRELGELKCLVANGDLRGGGATARGARRARGHTHAQRPRPSPASPLDCLAWQGLLGPHVWWPSREDGRCVVEPLA